ncbi:MAG: 50S ribosomal protein L35ae [Candidatus Pacearchaeota archaeon]|nr:MAG: 50S ribosomal protein L35ae [Candidatus Pacearchaeota archaeon]
MKATVVSFRRGRHTYKPRQFIIQTEKVKNKKDAEKYLGKEVEWKSPAGKIIKGKITASHGNKGLLRVVFEKGLPGQAINTDCEIK